MARIYILTQNTKKSQPDDGGMLGEDADDEDQRKCHGEQGSTLSAAPSLENVGEEMTPRPNEPRFPLRAAKAARRKPAIPPLADHHPGMRIAYMPLSTQRAPAALFLMGIQ